MVDTTQLNDQVTLDTSAGPVDGTRQPKDEPHLQTTPTVTWDDVTHKRDQELLLTEGRYNFDSPPAMIKAYTDYKQALRELISDAKAEGKEPWEVIFPHHPDEAWQPDGTIPHKDNPYIEN
jgi:hypothetical protein